MNTGIKWKIISFFVLIQILILSGIGLYLSTYLNNFFYQQMEASMLKQVELLSEILSDSLESKDEVTLQHLSTKLVEEINGRITIISNEGKVLADTEENPTIMENHGNRPEVIQARSNGIGWATRYSATLQIDMKYLAKKVADAGYVRLAIPVTEVKIILFKILGRLLVGFGIAFGLFVVLAWRVSQSITEPVERITAAAKQISRGNLSERIHIYTKDEIGTLSRVFNLMAHQLEETIKKISNEKERLATILENMADGLVALDRELKVILVNAAATQFFGIKEEDFLEKTLIQVNRNQHLTEAVQEAYSTGKTVSTEVHLHFPKEEILKVQLAPIIRNANEVHGLVLIFTDITELRRLEHLRTEFVGNVSHELKTPLTSIKGYVETLLDMETIDANNSSVVKRFLEVINKESERLARLINDLLDLSRLEGKRQHQLIPTHLGDVLENVVDILKSEARKKDIDLQIEIPVNLPRIMGIEEQLNQVLINLIDNGIKYTPAGGQVQVTLTTEEKWVVLRITDNGIGIPEENLDRIFERFYRVDKARTRQMGGTGLGLSIVKHIVKGHGGEIQVQSQVERGTTFIVKFKMVDQNA